jgi:hypothetical protein
MLGLNLVANKGITKTGVRAICESVRSGASGKLDWLDLFATECDASPYVDGHYWRMSRLTDELVEEFGVQRWMTLGSRTSSGEMYEVLTAEQQEFAQGMFRVR